MLTFFKTSNDIHLSPKHNQPPCTETHLSPIADSLPREDQDATLTSGFVWSLLGGGGGGGLGGRGGGGGGRGGGGRGGKEKSQLAWSVIKHFQVFCVFLCTRGL